LKIATQKNSKNKENNGTNIKEKSVMKKEINRIEIIVDNNEIKQDAEKTKEYKNNTSNKLKWNQNNNIIRYRTSRRSMEVISSYKEIGNEDNEIQIKIEIVKNAEIKNLKTEDLTDKNKNELDKYVTNKIIKKEKYFFMHFIFEICFNQDI